MRIYLKYSLITFLSAMLTFVAVVGGYTIYAQTAEELQEEIEGYYDFTDPTETFDYTNASYHDSMNDYFNDKIEMLVEMLDDPELFDNKEMLKNFYAPEDVNSENYQTKCSMSNVSTYCVAMEALNIYIAYVETLNASKGYLPTGEAGPGATIEDILNAEQDRSDKIEKEVANARVVLEGTLAAYNEFRLAYPLHKKYEQIINNLNKYRLALKKVRRAVRNYPIKFVDATSANCD